MARVRQVRVRQDAASSTHSTGRHRERLTPAPKSQGDTSIDLQPLSDEGKQMKDHIIRNMCSTNWETYQQVRNIPCMKLIWSVFMNGCMWAAFYRG